MRNFDLIQQIIIGIISFFVIISTIKIFRFFISKKLGVGKTSILVFIILLISASSVYTIAAYTLFGLFIVLRFLFNLKKRNKKPKEKINLNDTNSLYLNSNQGVIQIENPYRGIIVQGGAGSGKSKSFFYPIIDQLMQKKFSGLLYDFKSPELSEYAYAMHIKNNESEINFSFLNFKDYSISDRINPIAPRYVTKQAVAFELASVLINNLLPENIKKPDYWSRSSTAVVAGTIWFLRNNHPDKCTLPHLIAMILSFPSASLIDLLSKDLECSGMISSLKEAHDMKAEKQISGVIGTIKNALAQLNFPEVFYLLSKDNVNLNLNNPDNPTFLCLGNDSTLSTTYAPIISLIMSTCLRQMNEPNKIKSAVLVDEITTLYIPNLEQIPATARSNKIATILGLQDFSQLIDKYGEEKAQVLMSNLGNQFYGRTVNEKSAKMITNIFGKEDRRFESRSVSNSNSSNGSSSSESSSISVQERDRVRVSDITNLPAGRFYGIIAEGNKNEILSVQLGEVEASYKSFEIKTEGNIAENFKAIYNDVGKILNPTSSGESFGFNSNDEIKIELN